MVNGKVTGASLRLVTSHGRVITDESAAGNGLPLDRHIAKTKLALTQGLDLPSPPLGNLLIPHAHSFSADAESVSKGLMGPAEVIDDLVKCHPGGLLDMGSHGSSVSMLPTSVKRLTRKRKPLTGNLAYMNSKRRRATDPFAISRGLRMKAARVALGKSQQEIGEMVNRTREFVSQCESGIIVTLDRHLIKEFAAALGMPAQEFAQEPWEGIDGTIDLKVSTVARQLAVNFDSYPLLIQNQIRQVVANYENTRAQLGAEKAHQLYTPTVSIPKPKAIQGEQDARKKRTGTIHHRGSG